MCLTARYLDFPLLVWTTGVQFWYTELHMVYTLQQRLHMADMTVEFY